MKTGNMDLTGIDIDSSIVKLVEQVNQPPGIYPFSSCGGHKNNTEHQCAEGFWYVNFNCMPLRETWTSLDLIAQIADTVSDCELSIWYDAGINFELRGYNNIDDITDAIVKKASVTEWPFSKTDYQRNYMKKRRAIDPTYGQQKKKAV